MKNVDKDTNCMQFCSVYSLYDRAICLKAFYYTALISFE